MTEGAIALMKSQTDTRVPCSLSSLEQLGPSHPVFQPVVRLPDRSVIGYEVLTHWPKLDGSNSGWIFDGIARGIPDLAEVDGRCMSAALDSALQARLGPGALLFINTEPSCEFPETAVDRYAAALAERGIHVVFELTEHRLLTHPHTLLKKVHAIRKRGWSIAFDDVGVCREALPLLDVIRPDIIKLDARMVQRVPGDDESLTISAVLAHQERTQALLVAEGIESATHLKRAMAWGACLGQGFRFGRPRPAPLAPVQAPLRNRLATRVISQSALSPFQAVTAAGAVPQSALPTSLRALACHVARIAMQAVNPSITIMANPGPSVMPLKHNVIRQVAAQSSFLAVFGPGLSIAPGPGIVHVPLQQSDPLHQESIVLALGPHSAAALLVRTADADAQSGSRAVRRFSYVLTHDRRLVSAIAGQLLNRIH